MSTSIIKSFCPGSARSKLICILIIVGGLVAVTIIAAVPKNKSEPQVLPPPPVNVMVEQIAVIETMPDQFELDGTVEPNLVVNVAAEVPGRIERYGPYTGSNGERKAQQLDEGDPILAGQPLMYLNTELLQAAYNQAKAQYEQDQRDYARFKEARLRNVATQKEIDNARTALELSKANLQQVKAQLDRTTIFAPVSGIINRLAAEVGEYVQPGMTCAEIVDNETVKIVVNVPEQDISYFTVGQEQQILDRLNDQVSFQGKISYISEVAEPLARTTRVEISLPNKDKKLHSGQIVAVRMKRQDLHNAIMIPLDAIIPLEDGYMVYVVEDGKALPKNNIRIDIRSIKGKRIRVLSGLNDGEQLIVKGQQMCGPSQPVNIITAQPTQNDVAASQ